MKIITIQNQQIHELNGIQTTLKNIEIPKKSMEKATYPPLPPRDFDETQRDYLFIYLFITQLRTSMNCGVWVWTRYGYVPIHFN
jgi:hypothetical protein